MLLACARHGDTVLAVKLNILFLPSRSPNRSLSLCCEWILPTSFLSWEEKHRFFGGGGGGSQKSKCTMTCAKLRSDSNCPNTKIFRDITCLLPFLGEISTNICSLFVFVFSCCDDSWLSSRSVGASFDCQNIETIDKL